MAEYTKNLNLEKPDYGEYYDIGTFNANADKVDKGIEDSENRSTERLTVHKNSNDHTADKIRYSGKVGKDNVKEAIDETDTRIDNIVSQGGSDNTEVVDARHSTTKGKTYDTLKGRLEDGEQDIEKLKTDTSVSESVTETSYDSVIPVPDSAVNGQVSVSLKGETITNIFDGQALSESGERSEYEWDNITKIFTNLKGFDDANWATKASVRIKPLTTYTFICDVLYDNTRLEVKDRNNVALIPAVTLNKGKYITKFTTTSLQETFSIKIFDPDRVDVKSIQYPLLIEGDWTTATCKPNYITGTKSTIGSARVKSIGKNLINESEVLIEHGFEKTHEGYVLTNNDKVLNKIIWKNENMSYKGQIAVEINAKSEGALMGSYPRIIYSDGTETLVYYIANSGFNTKHVISQSGKIVDKITWKYGNWDSKTTIKHLMISKDINSEYEPYIEDRAYITAVKDNKIVNLRSLPNGTQDEISLSEKKAIIKIGTKTDVVSGTVINYTDMADGGQFVAYYEDGTQQAGVKGDTLTATATSLTYQLAEPEIIPIRWTGLQAYEGGTVYVDTVIPELGFYYDNGLESHHPDHPIKEVDTLYRVDKETGYKEPLDISKCAIAEDRLSFTHPDLVDGDLCDWDYVPMTESTRPETSLTFPTNLKASVNSLLGAEHINKKEHNIFKARLDNHDRDIERIDADIERIDDDIESIDTDIGNAQTAIDTAQSDIDTHKQDSNNPHNVTPEQIGAETPSGAQAKVDVVANDFESHKAETITDDVHGLYTHLGDLRIINFTLYSNSSVKLKFSEDTFMCLLLIQARMSTVYGAFVLQGYGIGGTRYKVGEIQKGSAISISVDEEGEMSFTVSNTSNVGASCRIVMFAGSPPEII